MTAPAQRSALAALQAARPTIARLETEQNSEDRAADLIEGWSAVETALRSLMGGSTLTGRALIHELRSRRAITLEQANALAEFEAARTRAERTAYVPTEADVGAARDALAKLETGLQQTDAVPAPETGSARAASRPPASTAGRADASPVSVSGPVETRSGAADWQKWLLGAIAVILVIAVGAWLYSRSAGQSTLQRAAALYKEGKREEASAAFERAAREDPKSALPHIYLSRMARDVSNLTVARDEANRAITLEPTNALALREMGAFLLTSGNAELARRFYVRAVQADTSDKTAKGYLGCALVRLGRVDEGRRWLTRAGPGTWSSCGTMAPGTPAAPAQPIPTP